MTELEESGCLPPGIYDLSLDEIKSMFGQFDKTDARIKLYEKLCDLVRQLSPHDFISHIIIDGSFVTSKSVPNDIDLILAVSQDKLNEMKRCEINPYEYNVMSSKRLRQKYGFDVLVAGVDSELYDTYLKLFKGSRAEDNWQEKGLVRYVLV